MEFLKERVNLFLTEILLLSPFSANTSKPTDVDLSRRPYDPRGS